MPKGDGAATGGTQRNTSQAKAFRLTGPKALATIQDSLIQLLEEALPDQDQATIQQAVDLVLRASANTTTITQAARRAEKGPSPRDTTRVFEHLDLGVLEDAINPVLWEKIQDRLPTRLTVAVDLTLIPYHGQPHDDEIELRRGPAKQGTTWHHAYATAYVCSGNKRYTLFIRYVRGPETVADVLLETLDAVLAKGIRPWLVLIDRAFYTLDAIRGLKERDLAFIMPLPLRGKRAKALCNGRGSYTTTYEVGKPNGEIINVAVAVKQNRDKYHGKKPGLAYFPYVYHGIERGPKRIDRLYRNRGGIETSYKLMNQARARTASRNPALRLFLFTAAMVVHNAWVTFAWELSPPKRGRTGRQRPKGFFPFTHLLEMLQVELIERYGVVLEVVQLPRWEAG